MDQTQARQPGPHPRLQSAALWWTLIGGTITALIGYLSLAATVEWPPFQSVAPASPAPATNGPAIPEEHVLMTIDNRVTNGPVEMREDEPAYLSSVAENFCKRNSCHLPNTDLRSGDQVLVVCQTNGEEATNGQVDGDVSDAANPDRHVSDLWYGVHWHDGRFGYLSEIWVHADSRGGLGLPECSRTR